MTNPVRQLLPNRRPTLTLHFDHEGIAYFGSVSFYEDGRPAEVFLDTKGKVGSGAQIIARDGAVAMSLALQHGCGIETLHQAPLKLEDGSSAGPFGKLIELVVGFMEEQNASS